MTTPYVESGGELVAVVPSRGPCWSEEEPCAIALDHKRRRKTGPPFGWVAVLRCSKHGRGFTAYPAGHVPYGRAPFVALAPDGSELAEGKSQRAQAAVAEAAKGKRWPRDGALETDGVRSTQSRRIGEAMALFGLAVGGAVTPGLAAAILHVAEGELVEASRLLAESHDLVRQGKELLRLVEGLARHGGRWLMDRVAVLGHLAAWWGRPWRWITRPAQLLGLGKQFWRAEHPPP